MKDIGIVRHVDRLGRIAIPKELRTSMQVEYGSQPEFWVDGDRIVMKKHLPGCFFCANPKVTLRFKERDVCYNCLVELMAIRMCNTKNC